MSPTYVKKLPWKFDIDRLQKELQPLKSLFNPWDPNTREEFNDSYILSFLHSKDCPLEKRLYDLFFQSLPCLSGQVLCI